MWDEAVYDSLEALKPIPNRFLTIKMVEKVYTALPADKNILYFDEDSDNAIFSCNKMGILNIDLKNINLDNNFDEDDHDTIILNRYLA